MKTCRWPAVPAALLSFGSVLLAQAPSTGTQSQEAVRRELDDLKARLERQEAELQALKAGGTGAANSTAPREGLPGYLSSQQAEAKGAGEGLKTFLGERLRLGGEIAVEVYDRNRTNGPLPGNAGPTTGDAGASNFRLRRFDLRVGVDIMEDFTAEGTVRFDPVVRDQDEGTVDVKEAYARFGNFSRHLFGFEDPSHTFVKMGTFYRWQRKKFDRGASEARSLSTTSYWLDEVTGLEVGGAFDFGFFYNVSLTNGSAIGVRDSGAGANNEFGGGPLSQAIFQDQEQLGDANNNKEFEGGLGFQVKMDDPRIGLGIAGFYRYGRLSAVDKTVLSAFSTRAATGFSSQEDRIGVLANASFETSAVDFGVQADYVYANDADVVRNSWGVGPWVKLKFDGARYGGRVFFTGFGVAYTFSQMQTEAHGIAAAGNVGLPYEDQDLHTITATLEITEHVDMLAELSLPVEHHLHLPNNEWLLQWRVRF